MLSALMAFQTLAPTPAWAQVAPEAAGAPAPALALAPAPASDAAFTLRIQAPDDVRQLLERNLDVLRYREQRDLSDGEMARLLIAAEKDARELLATMGYFSPVLAFDPPVNRSGVSARQLVLTIAPGAQVLVGDVQITFAGDLLTNAQAAEQRDTLRALWPLEVGMPWSQSRWSTAKQQALLQLTARHYPTAQITESQSDIDPATASARLTVTLDSGPRYRLGPMVITGLNHFDEAIVRRLARLELQDYAQADLIAAQQRITDSGYFDSASVTLDTSPGVDPANAPVRVLVREAKLQKLVLGLGASTDTGARLSLEHTHHKVPVLDWRAVTRLLLARDNSSLATELTSHPNDGGWRWSVGGVVQQQTLGSFLIHSQGLRVGRSRSTQPLDNDYYLQYDRADSATSDATAATVVEAVSANYGFTVRRFDHPLFPNRGWGFGAAVGAGVTTGVKADPYSRFLLRGQSYLPLGTPTSGGNTANGRLALRAQVGAILAEPSASLPSTQLFYLGGDNSVRGYGYNDLGVRLPDGLITGGRTMGLASVEWQRPIRVNGRISDWESTLFIDAGAVANGTTEFKPKVGIGAGARWKSPVGPLQIDLAYGVDVQRLRLHLNVGFNF